ncbi:MAG: type II toxin-antitoxin system HicA family toxin [Tannerella sp.]|jgi:predicted RNA binding protein YcfA (HicA-like mRNA interferase family)|nr:type II toxin-antitoxin system HicA family toxin [Tannerella sp.]
MKIWKVREITSCIKRDGWYLVRQKGSHRHYRHPSKPGTVTIPGEPGDDLPPGTAKSILAQAGLKEE